MGQSTLISWCDSTVNPTSGCDGCELWDAAANRGPCYAGTMHVSRLSKCLPSLYAQRFADIQTISGRVERAARWCDLRGTARPAKSWLDGQPRVIFVGDMGDLFSNAVPCGWICDHVIDPIMSDAGRRHFWIMVTKQPKRAGEFARELLEHEGVDLHQVRNLMLLVSVTSQRTFERIAQVQQAGFAWFGASFEPLLGPVDLSVASLLHADEIGRDWARDPCPAFETAYGRYPASETSPWWPPLDWAIAGGMSGTDAVPCDVAWLRALRDQASLAGTPFFCKQLGARPFEGDWLKPADSHGWDWAEWPADLRVRQVPDFAAMMGSTRKESRDA